ncbi:MAG: FKBP-type peptidyl-prolyl cis-trans isomerase [Lachnospiraceae bacterium]|nr:FKBP-type peptidyl-prolyl cis-trans isomerase [Lachnospiraceae bacterium]
MNDSELKEINDTVEEVTSDIEETANGITSDIEETANDITSDIKETVNDASSDIKETVEDIKSHSQVKREQRRKEVKQARRKAKTASIVGYVCLAVVCVLVIWGIVALVSKQLDKVVPNENYSEGLAENGYISGVTASDKITLPEDYKNIKVPYSEIEFTDEEIDSEIESLLAGYSSLNTDEATTVKDGDDVEIAYVGTVDGVEFDGGSSDSYKLTIGSGTFIEGFEEQLIGANVGSTVEVNVTFPEDYASADLAGKDAVFTVDVNGVYEPEVFDDDFVAENFSDKASTAEEYREYVRSTHEDENLETYIKDYLTENTTVKSYPSKYVRTLKGIQMYDDQQSYEYMNQMYQSYYGSAGYDSFESYIGMTMDEYYQSLKDKAKDTCKVNMIWQAIVEKEGATVDADYYKSYLTEKGQDASYYDTMATTSGEAFVLQQAIAIKGLEIVKAGATVEK